MSLRSDVEPEEEKILLNKVVIFVFVHQKYSRRFIKLRFNHCSHVDTLINLFVTEKLY